MDDRKLLELAAKAAGKRLEWRTPINAPEVCNAFDLDAQRLWNPLTDDGDALRMAVRLRISPILRLIGCDATDSGKGMAYEKYGQDDLAATRRAIVRAAAEIGRSTLAARRDHAD